LFKSLFVLDNTSLPLKYRNSLLSESKTKHLTTIIPTSYSVASNITDDNMSITSEGAVAEKVDMPDTGIVPAPNRSSKELLRSVQDILDTSFAMKSWYRIRTNKSDSTKIPPTEHLLTMVRYRTLDTLAIKYKKTILKHYISHVIMIDDVRNIELRSDEKDTSSMFFKRLAKIYITYNLNLHTEDHILKLIKKHQQYIDTLQLRLVATKLVEADITSNTIIVTDVNTKESYIESRLHEWIILHEVILIITLYVKYDPKAAQLLMGKLRDIPHIINDYEQYEHFNPFIRQGFEQYIYNEKNGKMAHLYDHVNDPIKHLVYTLFIMEYYDCNKNIYRKEHRNYNILRKRRDMEKRRTRGLSLVDTDDMSNEVVGFILRYTHRSLTKQQIFLFFSPTNTFGENGISILSPSHEYNYLQFIPGIFNKNELVGFNIYIPKRQEIVFKLLDITKQVKKTKGGKVNKKFINRGVVCGGGNIRMRIPNLQKDIEKILGIKLVKESIKIIHFNGDNKVKLSDLCNMLSILLRYKEYEGLFKPIDDIDESSGAGTSASASASASVSASASSGTSDIKWFYNYEESLFLKF